MKFYRQQEIQKPWKQKPMKKKKRDTQIKKQSRRDTKIWE